jgi:Outer membrane protein beta-barrel domain
MKKILTLVLILCSFSLLAQTTRGSFMIGGNGSVNFNNNDRNDDDGNPRSFSFNLSPTVGYFPLKNFAFGLSLPFDVSWSKRSSSYTSPPTKDTGHGYSISVAPFVRYYIPVKKLFIVTQAAYGWSYSKNEFKTTEAGTGIVMYSNEITVKGKYYTLSAGPAFFLNPYTSIEILANYQSQDWDAASTTIIQPFNQSTWYISVGFQIYLPSNKE